MVKDPVCGMQVDERLARERSQFQGRSLYFCSAQCKQLFDNDPQRYLTQGGRPAIAEQQHPRH